MGRHVPLFGAYRIHKYVNRHIRMDIRRGNKKYTNTVPSETDTSLGTAVAVIIVIVLLIIVICPIINGV